MRKAWSSWAPNSPTARRSSDGSPGSAARALNPSHLRGTQNQRAALPQAECREAGAGPLSLDETPDATAKPQRSHDSLVDSSFLATRPSQPHPCSRTHISADRPLSLESCYILLRIGLPQPNHHTPPRATAQLWTRVQLRLPRNRGQGVRVYLNPWQQLFRPGALPFVPSRMQD